jgi:predicted dithiol-disulfide oxidoreductase (DUF899 family)
MAATTQIRPSTTYQNARVDLLRAEIDLKEQIERVAALRRALPAGPVIDTDYTFHEGPADLTADDEPVTTHFSELFGLLSPYLIVDHLMFGEEDDEPCPMCSLWADGYSAVARHVSQRAAFVLVAKADIRKLRDQARRQGWDGIRLLSSHGSSFNRDVGVEDDAGNQKPGVSVFERDVNGSIRLTYSVQAELTPEHNRGIDLYTPVWNLFDLLPNGRGEWFPSLNHT